MGDFKLSASLTGHEDDVRGVAFAPDHVVSASRDGTVRVWKTVSSPPPKFDDKIMTHGTEFVNAVAYLPPSDAHPEGLVISGGKDTIIDVRKPSSTPDDNAEAMMIGHAGNVCALDVDPAGRFIVSGSWDNSARIWPIGKWEAEHVLEGHGASVWAVLAYDSKYIITACADQSIRIFNSAGSLLKTLKGGSQPVRALCRLPRDHPSGAHFASAGNDGMIRLWKLDGSMVGEFEAHENFIYSLAVLPTGEIVSSGEDRTVRIWKDGTCIQTITHPAISVWAVAVCSETGDIVSGASDKKVRVFTRSSERVADAETIEAFEESVKASAIPQQGLSEQINKEKLPGPEYLQQKSGTKEGQTQMIREPNGSISAHQWSVAAQQWVNIGTVVEGAGSSGNKITYKGKDYDYVFDVDIEDGKPPLKLPYNIAQNPYEAATKFIGDNELPVTYLDQVANFIVQNTQGATLGQSAAPPTGPEPWGTESRYRPGDQNVTSAPTAPPAPLPKILPQKDYLLIDTAKFDGMQRAIIKVNQTLLSSGRKDISLNPTQLGVLDHMGAAFQSGTDIPSIFSSVSGCMDLAVKIGTEWPYRDRLAGLDLLRLLAKAPAAANYSTRSQGSIVAILLSTIKEETPVHEHYPLMATRFFCNLFAHPEGRELVVNEFASIHEFASQMLDSTAAIPVNTLTALATLFLNFAVSVWKASNTGTEDAEDAQMSGTGEKGLEFDQMVQVAELLTKLLKSQKYAEAVYRALVALGTLCVANEEVKEAVGSLYDGKVVVEGAVKKQVEARCKRVGGEVVAALGA